MVRKKLTAEGEDYGREKDGRRKKSALKRTPWQKNNQKNKRDNGGGGKGCGEQALRKIGEY